MSEIDMWVIDYIGKTSDRFDIKQFGTCATELK